MKNPYDQIWESALRLIQVRMTSRHELQKKLLAKFPQEEGEIPKVLDEMERVLLLDDKRYTEQLVHHLTQKPIGRLKLKLEARKRGIDENLFESLLQDAGYDEAASAKQALEERMVPDTRPYRTGTFGRGASAPALAQEEDPRKRKFKLMNFLRNRGFTDATIYGILK